MDPAGQGDAADDQITSSIPGDTVHADMEDNDENNNIVPNSDDNMAAEESSASAAAAGEGQEEEVPAEVDDTVGAEPAQESSGENDTEGQGRDVDVEEGKDETSVEDPQNEGEKSGAEETAEPGIPDKEITEDGGDQETSRPEASPGPKSPDEDKAATEQEVGQEQEVEQEPEVTAEDAVDAKSEGESNAGDSLIPTPTPATKIRLNGRKHTTTPADDSGLAQPVLPNINKGQANVQQMTTSITHARRKQDGLVPISRQPVRSRVPPKLVRLATVTVAPAKSRPNRTKTASLYYEEPRRPAKVITWDQATNHRPPLRIDMEGPGPCSYSPLNKPLGETNAPCFTFGTKCYPEKDGGARTSWGKSWFQSHHLWHSKADYTREGLWPSPNHYPKTSLLGPRQRTMTEAPSYTFGHKQAFSIVKPGAAKEPSPNDYERQNADSLVLKRGPSFTHQFRREGTVLWGSSEKTPAPCSYAPDPSPRVQRPAYTIQGIRREKSHILGPYSTL